MKSEIFIILIIYCVLDLAIGTICIKPKQSKRDAYYHHDLKKYFKNKVYWGTYYNLCTNSLGFKDNSRRTVLLRNDKYRILFIGDSFTEGIGFPYNKTFVGIIDQNLEKKHFEVLNAAVYSYSPKLYYLKMKYFIEEKKLHFDELFVYIDISDIPDEVVYKSFIPSKSWVRVGIIDLKTFLRQHSLLYATIYKVIDKLISDHMVGLYQERVKWVDDPLVFKKYGEKGLNLAKQNMELLYNLCKKYGIKMTVAIYPWPDQIRLKDLTCMPVVTWHAFCEEKKISFINYFPDFINNNPAEDVIDKYFIKGDVHLNEAGHNLIAQKWLQTFKKTENEKK